jgi:D-tyrosyl-tRNA(Tyr) deacylase
MDHVIARNVDFDNGGGSPAGTSYQHDRIRYHLQAHPIAYVARYLQIFEQYISFCGEHPYRSGSGVTPLFHMKNCLGHCFSGYALQVQLATHTPPIKEDDMRALLQRVTEAEVKVDGQTIGATGTGLLILICAMAGDTQAEAVQLINKITKLRLFKDDTGKMNKSIMDISGSALVVSQFTLAADTKRGNRPGFSNAAPPDGGRALYEYFADGLAQMGVPVETGKFGADMQVRLINDGPVTIWLDTAERK